VPEIKISSSVYERLLRRSRSFDDTPDDVIGQLLDDAEDGSSSANTAASKAEAGTPRGSILPVGDYWLPILGIIVEAGGSALANNVIDALEEQMGHALGDRDRERLRNGEVRWRNRARFARLRMKEHGLLSNTSLRGIWEITDAGRAYLERNRAR
jgi:hypothetical protein